MSTLRPPLARRMTAAIGSALPATAGGALLAVALVLPAARAAGQTEQIPIPSTLTLEMALEILRDNNPTILAARDDLAAVRADVVAARRLPNPMIAYEAEGVGGAPDPDASFWNDQDLKLLVEQPIPIGGRRGALGDVADQAVLAAQSGYRDTVRHLTLELQRRYYAVVLAEQELALAGEILGRFDQVVQLMQRRYDEGEASGLELARLRTERLRFFNDQVDAEANVAGTRTALLELLGARSLETRFGVSEQLAYEPAAVDVAALEAEALAERPDLSAQRFEVQRAARGHDYQRSLRIPDLVPYVGYNRDFGQDDLAFGVSLAVPILNRNQGGIARALAETDRERDLLRGRELLVRREVRQAFIELSARARLVRALEAEYVPSAEQARDIAQASYALGALDLIEFLDAERAYRETVRGYYRALYDHQVARFALDAAVGREEIR